jgi:hypothetical protein
MLTMPLSSLPEIGGKPFIEEGLFFDEDSSEEEEPFLEELEAAAKTGGFALNSCTLMGARKDDSPRPPVGVEHKDDGVQTPDHFSWAHSLDRWWAVYIWHDVQVLQIMSQSRLSMALEFIGKY